MKIKKVKELLANNEIDRHNIIDIREGYEQKLGKISGSRNIPMNKLLGKPEKFLKKDQKYYIICQSGTRSFATYINLKLKKYKVVNISGGYQKWEK